MYFGSSCERETPFRHSFHQSTAKTPRNRDFYERIIGVNFDKLKNVTSKNKGFKKGFNINDQRQWRPKYENNIVDITSGLASDAPKNAIPEIKSKKQKLPNPKEVKYKHVYKMSWTATISWFFVKLVWYPYLILILAVMAMCAQLPDPQGSRFIKLFLYDLGVFSF